MGGMEVVGCGVDAKPAGSVAPRADQILHVGRLVRHKQVEWAIEAVSDISRDIPGYSLRIVGAGYAESDLRALVTRLGLGGRVSFSGNVDDMTLRQEYEHSRALLFPSTQEGFGMVLIEAMAAGTPAIALDAPNSAAGTIVSDGRDGLLVRSKSEMTQALRKLLTDPALWQRLSEGALASARKHDWDTAVVPALEAYYRKVVGG